MFTKPIKLTTSTLLKKKDVKKLCETLATQNSYTTSVEASDSFQLHAQNLHKELVPGRLKRFGVSPPSNMLVYVDEECNVPIFADISGKKDLCYTVYAIWRGIENGTHLLPTIKIDSPASKYILRGADVMLPGVVSMSICSLVTTEDADGTELTAENHAMWCQVHAGSIWAICAEGNPYPFAVGQLQMHPEELQSMMRKPKLARKGKLIKIWHVFGDELWKMGTQSAPNDGFSIEEISPVNHPHDQQLKDNQQDVQVESSDAAHLNVKEPITTSDKNLIDQWLNESLFQAIKVGAIKQKQLPMLTNVFFASILLPCRRAGHVLDIKRSSYKQVSVFLKYMAAELVIEVEEKNGIQSVTSIDHRHPRVVSHEMYLMDSEAEQDASAHSHDQMQKSPIIEELYRLSPKLWRLIGSEEQQKDTKSGVYFTAAEIRNLLGKYTQEAGLEDARNKACVRLDANLTDILYPKKLASTEKYPLKLPRKDIIALLFVPSSKHCIKHHSIKLPSGSEKIIRGDATKIEICAKKIKNSIATTVANLEMYQVDMAECAKEVRRMWGCNATVTTNPAHAHRTEVMISGQMAKEFVTYLETKHNIPSKFCRVSYGKGVRLKK